MSEQASTADRGACPFRVQNSRVWPPGVEAVEYENKYADRHVWPRHCNVTDAALKPCKLKCLRGSMHFIN